MYGTELPENFLIMFKASLTAQQAFQRPQANVRTKYLIN